jgi:hypothetical protein
MSGVNAEAMLTMPTVAVRIAASRGVRSLLAFRRARNTPDDCT